MQKKRRRRTLKYLIIMIFIITIVTFGLLYLYFIIQKTTKTTTPQALILDYMKHIEKQEYEAMYSMLAPQSTANINQEKFISRNANIYEGIETQNLTVDNIQIINQEEETVTISYNTSFHTIAGDIQFENQASFVETEDGYKLIWDDSLIFPDLSDSDKVRVSTSKAVRGEILDRNGTVLAGKGLASSVGIVPGKLKDKAASVQRLSELLEMDMEIIENKLQAQWVTEDSFVPINTIPKVNELDLKKVNLDEETLKEKERQEELLDIPGVMITDTEVRTYELGEAAAHLIGYVQNVTAEDLEEHKGEGYSSDSVIGRSGMEGLYEKELKGQDGCEIYIENAEGEKKESVAVIIKQDGQDIKLTIDAYLQRVLYEQFEEDKSCSVAMDPYTGEVLALVSTPSFDNNDFLRGMADEQWNVLNEDEKKPLFNRFRQTWCPGSAFKPITAAIGLQTGSVNPDEDFGNEGLSWRKDETWGSYMVTTLHEYEPVILENALIYSDNIYFAKAALKIGEENFTKSLKQLGFNEQLPFEIVMSNSQYSNTDRIETEIQLADSGYGQGQILVNPLHLASLYTAFLNQGNVVKPYLLYEKEKSAQIWIPQAFSQEVSSRVLEGLIKVVNNPNGTGYAAHRDDIVLAGKTGTAEIKASKEDVSGTELGWFSVFTADKKVVTPILIVSMVEDVKDIGGSGYVVKKDKNVLDYYLQQKE